MGADQPDLEAELEAAEAEALAPSYGLAEHVVGVTLWGKVEVRADEEALDRGGRLAPAAPDARGRWLTCWGFAPATR